jgi:lactate dehydrogenase-like 2-hydroxyacid dehydrogenase
MNTPLPPILQVGEFPGAMQSELTATLTTTRSVSAEVKGILTRSNCKIPPSLLDQLPSLQVISTCGVGFDGIPLEITRARGIAVSNTPGVLNDAVCELTIGILIGLLRRIPDADQFVKDGRWEQGLFPLSRSLAGSRIGIVGMGRIGQDLAERLVSFKTSIAYFGPRPKPVPYAYCGSLKTLAEQSDILILTCPGGPETDRLITAEILSALGPRGILVNMSRGSVIDEAALITALQNRSIAGAALDVFEREPHVPQALRLLDNVLLTPHVGSATEETRVAMTRLAVDNLKSFFSTGHVLTPVE